MRRIDKLKELSQEDLLELLIPSVCLNYDPWSKLFFLSRNGGPFLIKREKALKIINLLQQFYDKFSTEEIDNRNKEIHEELKRQDEILRQKVKQQRENSIYKKQEGYTYFLKARTAERRVKIGKTKKLDHRILQISPKLPFKIDFLFAYQTIDYDLTERKLHNHFSKYRLNGEWFDLSDNQLNRFKSLQIPSEIKKLIKGLEVSL